MTVAEIKKIMTDAFIADPEVIAKYELESGKSFEDGFSPVSIESIWFFIVATAVWLSFQMFGQLKTDIEDTLNNRKAHTNKWYAMKALAFQYGYNLATNSDVYDNSMLTAEQVESSKIVKFAAALQPKDKSVLYIKVAAETSGRKHQLNNTQLTALTAYFDEISDAGVRYVIINAPADQMKLEIDIYYNPLLFDSDGKRLDGSDNTPVSSAIRNHISNLPFNGLYTNQALIDALQQVDGVDQAELKGAYSKYGTYTLFQKIDGRSIPYAGYYDITDSDLIINYIANEEYL
jgi:hypothetical protein